MTYHLAVDLGASSGKLILGSLQAGRLVTEEVYRFENLIIPKEGSLCWDLTTLFGYIKVGIKKCCSLGKKPVSIGIDTWGVDFVLLDHRDQILGEAVSYRDKRTSGVMEEVLTVIKKETIFKKTGLQFLPFNTLYQLIAIKKRNPAILDHARTFLMLPDYFHFLLTGTKTNEYTNATTTQMVNVSTGDWNRDLLNLVSIPTHLFQTIKPPGTRLGNLRDELAKELGCQMEVILPATHDTGSAFMTVRSPETTIVLSLGTWALLGIESSVPLLEEDVLANNFTNEGGYGGTFRILKNRMGLWMIQEVKRLLGHGYSFELLTLLAEQASDFSLIIDVNHPRFLNPLHMIEEIKTYCRENQLIEPQTPGEIIRCIAGSMVKSYLQTIEEIERISRKEYDTLQVIGGGSRNRLLQQLITKQCHQKVRFGPVEATACGNLLCQMIAWGEIRNLEEGRAML